MGELLGGGVGVEAAIPGCLFVAQEFNRHGFLQELSLSLDSVPLLPAKSQAKFPAPPHC